MSEDLIVCGVEYVMGPREDRYTMRPLYLPSEVDTRIQVVGVGWLTPRQCLLLNTEVTALLVPGKATKAWCKNLEDTIRRFLEGEEAACKGLQMSGVELRLYPAYSSYGKVDAIRVDLTFDPFERGVTINVWHHGLPDFIKTGIVKEAKKWLRQPPFTPEGIKAAQSRLESVVLAYAQRGTVDLETGIPEPDSPWWKSAKQLAPSAPERPGIAVPERIRAILVVTGARTKGDGLVAISSGQGGVEEVVVRASLPTRLVAALSLELNKRYAGAVRRVFVIDAIRQATLDYLARNGYEVVVRASLSTRTDEKRSSSWSPANVHLALMRLTIAVNIDGARIWNAGGRYKAEFGRLQDLIGKREAKVKVLELAKEVLQERRSGTSSTSIVSVDDAAICLLGKVLAFVKAEQEAEARRKPAFKQVIRKVERLGDLRYTDTAGGPVFVPSTRIFSEFSAALGDWVPQGTEGSERDERKEEEEDGEKPKTRKFDWI